MSWSVAVPAGTPEELKKSIEAAELGEYVTYAREVAQQQLDTAKSALQVLLDSKAVGRAGSTFIASMGGHANPEHTREGNWALEFVTVTLTEVTEALTAPELPADSGDSNESADKE